MFACSPHCLVDRRGLLLAGAATLAACTLAPDRDHADADAPRAEPLRKSVRTAWVFSSGGPRGFVHVGVLKALQQLRLTPDLIVGASAGALVGSLFASGMQATDMEALALDLHPFGVARWAVGADELLSGAGIADMVRQRALVPWLERMPIPMACVTARRRDGAVVALTTGDVGIAVQAATAIEGRFAPVRIRGEQYVDADWSTPLPVRVARALGAQRVLAIDASAHMDRIPPNAQAYLASDLRKKSLVDAEAVLADLVIKPDFGYWAGISREYRQRVMAAGYRDTLVHASALQELHAS